jgi:hypothetical protein
LPLCFKGICTAEGVLCLLWSFVLLTFDVPVHRIGSSLFLFVHNHPVVTCE